MHAPNTAATPELAALDKARRAWATALMQRDGHALAALVDEGLVYVHSTGIVQDCDPYLEYVKAGPRFLAVEMRDANVRLRDGTAIVNGKLHLTLLRPGETSETQVTALATQVWFRDGAAWRLTAGANHA